MYVVPVNHFNITTTWGVMPQSYPTRKHICYLIFLMLYL